MFRVGSKSLLGWGLRVLLLALHTVIYKAQKAYNIAPYNTKPKLQPNLTGMPYIRKYIFNPYITLKEPLIDPLKEPQTLKPKLTLNPKDLYKLNPNLAGMPRSTWIRWARSARHPRSLLVVLPRRKKPRSRRIFHFDGFATVRVILHFGRDVQCAERA